MYKLHSAKNPHNGTEVVFVLCTDNYIHIFEADSSNMTFYLPAVCRKDVTVKGQGADSDFMCEKCSAGIESWMQGGTLHHVEDK